jgi:anti-sigma regulatory factor (Ser/Thr protein kinase)
VEIILNPACEQFSFPVSEPSEIAATRRAGSELARRLGFDETITGRVAIVITEAATNILKHATRGEILLRPLQVDDMRGIEIIAIDSGPGMVNLALSVQDGMSTAGSYGVGLGAMRRLASEFDVYTAPGNGTVVYMALWSRHDFDPASRWQIGVVSLPMPGEEVCGDSWAVNSTPDFLNIVVADGLGHGPEAADASRFATSVIASDPDQLPAASLQHAHGLMRGTRGAAVAIVRIDPAAENLHFAGVGNIAACLFDAGTGRRHLVSHNGIVGSNMRKVQEYAAEWHAGSMLIMHSDGIGTRWNLASYHGLEMRHPVLIAAVLYRDFARKRDDITVLVIRETPGY